jgi:hypothetical protein
MKNDYKMIHCEKCGSPQQHYNHWKCGEYTICLGCSNAGRKNDCGVCTVAQIANVTEGIEAHANYKPPQTNGVSERTFTLVEGGLYKVSVRRHEDQHVYTWNLRIEPDKNAWKLVNQQINVGQEIYDHTVLAVEIVFIPDR